MHMLQQQSIIKCVSKVHLAKENITARGMPGAWEVAHRWLPALLPQQSKLICSCLTSPPSVRVCAHMLLGPHAGLGGGEMGSVLENIADARIKQRTREKLSNLPCFCNKFSFFLSRQSENGFNAFIVFSFMRSHLCLWTVNKTEICMCYALPCHARVSLEMRRWESEERSLRCAGSLEGCGRARPAPGHHGEPSSSSRLQHHSLSFSFGELSRAPLSWAERYLEDWGVVSFALVRECCWKLDLWLITEKTVHFSENKVRGQQMQGTNNGASSWTGTDKGQGPQDLLFCLHPTFHLFLERYFHFFIPPVSSLKCWFFIMKNSFRTIDGMINNVISKCDIIDMQQCITKNKEQMNIANPS